MPPHIIDRRAVLRWTAGAGLGASLPWARLVHAEGAAAGLVPRRVFFADPDYRNVRISPDGRHLAYLAPRASVRNLWVAPVDAPQAGRPLTRVTDRDIGAEHHWAFNNRQLIFFQDREGDENWRASSIDIETGVSVPLTPPEGVVSYVQGIDRNFPDDVLFGHNARDKRYFDIFRINLVTGKSQLVFENPGFAQLLTDAQFRLRIGVRFAADGTAELFEHTASGDWNLFTTVPIGDIDSTNFIDFSRDGSTLYVLDTRGRDKAALYALDMRTRQRRLLAEDAEADITYVDFADRQPVAPLATNDRARWHALDAGARKDLAALDRYGAGDLWVENRSLDGNRAVAFLERDTESGEYALVGHEQEKGAVRHLYTQRKALANLQLRPFEPVAIKARDGLMLRGYLTRPSDAAGARPPLVLVIHGGPYARDYWGFNATHQWLANRGYAALSVNYRGSTGFGKAFVKAADHEWGGRMHDDLIDALDWALARGIADPARVGFLGGSYGGYSALMAATKTPDRFTCIVDLFGVSNLITFMATIPPYWGPWFSIWKNRLGDPATKEGRAFLIERSPLTHIERATKPILIAQGAKDVRVVRAESEQMVAALTKKGVPVTYITFPDEGHGFVRPKNRLACNAVIEAFLAQHLGGRAEPVGNDFAGSSIRIEVGRELVPGLPA
ncbi:MAG TPA: S9 family peptidase [Stellaceae bacterium]|nr:S9 family peptidase [Stellaceae bacterium]